MPHPIKAEVSPPHGSAIARLSDTELERASGGDKAPPPPPHPIYLSFNFKLVAV
jgi:hypothetical protein